MNPAKLLYELYSRSFNIGVQKDKGDKDASRYHGPMPWESLPVSFREKWAVIALDYRAEIIKEVRGPIIKDHEDSKRRAEAEKDRKAMRADVYEQEVRRRVAEEISNMAKRG